MGDIGGMGSVGRWFSAMTGATGATAPPLAARKAVERRVERRWEDLPFVPRPGELVVKVARKHATRDRVWVWVEVDR